METDNPFEAVLDRLREKGWTKHSLGTPSGPNCLLGANMFLKTNINFYDSFWPIAEAEYPNRGGMVSSFNNHPDTTFADVERVLEEAAVKWEEERVMRDE